MPHICAMSAGATVAMKVSAWLHVGCSEGLRKRGAAGKRFAVIACGICHEQVAHYNVSCHFYQAACHEIGIFGLLTSSTYCTALSYAAHISRVSHADLPIRFNVLGCICVNEGAVCAGGDVADGSHDLKLGGAFVDRGDAGIAVHAFAGVVFHEA